MKKLVAFLILNSLVAFSQDAVLIHGWLGNGAIWDGTVPKQVITSWPFSFNRVLQPSLDGYSASAIQAANMHSYLTSNNVSNGVGIAYSMGGINARYYLRVRHELAQQQRLSQLYTIGTPHLGTRAANNVVTAGRHLIISAAATLYPGWISEDIPGIFNLHYYSFEAAMIAYALLEDPILRSIIEVVGGPALHDLEVGSPAVNYINEDVSYEQNLIKVGIAGTEINPVSYRLVAPFLGLTENEVLLFEQDVTSQKWFYLIWAMIDFVESQTPENLSTLAANVATYVYFKHIDWIWRTYVLESQESDGIVSKTSQIYPNYNRQFFATLVSHEEQKYSNVVGNYLSEGLTYYGNSILQGPENLHATIDLPGNVTLTWDQVPNATSYVVYRDGDNPIGSSAVPTFIDHIIGSHTYVVRAVVGGMEGPPSNSVNGHAMELQSPSSVIAEGLPYHVRLSWDPVAGATAYRIYRGVSATGTFVEVASTTNTLHLEQVPNAPQVWYYYVVGLAGQFEGLSSNTVDAEAYHLASSSPNATAPNTQRKIIRDGGGRYHIVYESANKIWYTRSTCVLLPDGVVVRPLLRFRAGKSKKIFVLHLVRDIQSFIRGNELYHSAIFVHQCYLGYCIRFRQYAVLFSCCRQSVRLSGTCLDRVHISRRFELECRKPIHCKR